VLLQIKINEVKKSISVFALLLISYVDISAQGDGPRAFLLAPKGVTGINVKWLNLDQNIIPAGTALIPGAEIHVNVFPITLFHTFSLGGRIAQAYAMINPGSATARAKIGPPIGPIPVNELSADGISDGFVAFKIGLKGTPALNVLEFAKSPMQFSLFADARFWYSGTYSSDDLFNLGTNRFAFQLGLPMSIPLNKSRSSATWLEIAPSIMLYGDNNDPARSSTANKVSQAPLFLLENHLSHNFTPKFWAVANLRFQFGGETSADGVKDDNAMSIMGGGLGVGYQLLPPLSIAADYGGVLLSDKDAKGKMFRLSVVFTYANLNKLQP
jgi:Putative MetA-pathway of phenol degradation